MVRVGARARDVVRVHRGERACNDDEEEDAERPERDVVPPEPSPRKVAGAAAGDRLRGLGLGEVGRDVEVQVGCRLGYGTHLPWSLRGENGGGIIAPAGRSVPYFM